MSPLLLILAVVKTTMHACNKDGPNCANVQQLLTHHSKPPVDMQAAFGIDLNPAWVMELESDAHHKFSRHLIIQIPGMAFANNLEVGSFVSAVCDKAVQPSSGSSSLQVAKVIST